MFCPLLLSLVACGLNDTPMESTPVTSATAVSYYPVTVTDQAGREVTITEEPKQLLYYRKPVDETGFG